MNKVKKDEKVEEVPLQEEAEDQDLKQSADPKDAKIAELEDQLARAVADYRNLERRSSEERIEAIKFANKQLLEVLLPAFDTLFLAEKYTQDESIKLTIQRILEVLKDNGIEKINTVGAQYNAETMEAVEVIEGEEGKIVEELRPGFIINGKLIRPAQVKVGGGNK